MGKTGLGLKNKKEEGQQSLLPSLSLSLSGPEQTLWAIQPDADGITWRMAATIMVVAARYHLNVAVDDSDLLMVA